MTNQECKEFIEQRISEGWKFDWYKYQLRMYNVQLRVQILAKKGRPVESIYSLHLQFVKNEIVQNSTLNEARKILNQ